MSHLETAAFTLHIMLRTRRNHRVFAGRVFSSSSGLLACQPQLSQPRRKHAGVLHIQARADRDLPARPLTWKDSF